MSEATKAVTNTVTAIGRRARTPARKVRKMRPKPRPPSVKPRTGAAELRRAAPSRQPPCFRVRERLSERSYQAACISRLRIFATLGDDLKHSPCQPVGL